MEARDIQFFSSGAEFAKWLTKHGHRETELWMGFRKRGSGLPGITYAEALDEALCVGWIDGLRKNLDETSYLIRFTPRKPRSIWSEVNRKRAAELQSAGRMKPAGLREFEAASAVEPKRYSYEADRKGLEGPFLEKMRGNFGAWEFFGSQAPWYQRTAGFWVMSAKREETRWRRLNILIAASLAGKRIDALTVDRRPKTAKA